MSEPMIRNVVSELLDFSTICTSRALKECTVATAVTSLVAYTSDMLAVIVPNGIGVRIML